MVLTKQQIVQRVNWMQQHNVDLPTSKTAQSTVESINRKFVNDKPFTGTDRLGRTWIDGERVDKNSVVTVTGTNRGTVIPVSSLTTPTTAYNTYDESNIQHAKELQKSGNILQKVASTIYLGVNDASVRGSAKDWENFVDSKNAYGVKFSQGEKANTGDAFKDFMANVSGNLFLIPSNLQRQVAGGLMAVSDMTTANANAVKTGNISLIAQQQAKTVSAVGQAGKDYAINLGQTLRDPEALTAIAITAGLGAGVGSFATKAVNTGSKVKVTTITPKTGNISVNGNTLTLTKGKTVTIPLGKNTVKITKGTTKTGDTIKELRTVNSSGKTNTLIGKMKTGVIDTIPDELTGNIVFTGQRTLTVIRKGNRAISTEKKTALKTITKNTDGLSINAGRIRTATKQTHKRTDTTRQYLKLNKSGEVVITKERLTRKNTRTRTDTTLAGNKNKNSLATVTGKETVKETVIKKKGKTTKKTEKGKTKKTARLTAYNNFSKANLLPGSTKATRSTGTTIKIDNGQLFIIGNKGTAGKVITYNTGKKAGEIDFARIAGNSTIGSKKTVTNPRRISNESRIKTVIRPNVHVQDKVKIKTEKKTAKAEVKQHKKEYSEKPDIVGYAVDDGNGHISRYKPKGYDAEVMKVQRQIKTGRLSEEDRSFLQNRRDNKMGKSGDAEALYGRRKMMESQKKLDDKKKPKLVSNRKMKRLAKKSVYTIKSPNKQPGTRTAPTVSSTQYHDAGNGMMYATKTASKTETKTAQKVKPVIVLEQKPPKLAGKTKQETKQKKNLHPVATVGSIISANKTTPATATAVKTGNGQMQVMIQKQTHAGNKTKTNTKSQSTTKGNETKTKTDAKTKTETKSKSGNTNKRKTGPVVKSAVKSAVALARPQKQAVKQEQKPKQKPKSAVSTKNRKKPKLLHLEDEAKKRRKTTKTKKSKYAIRKETINQFGWLGFDPKKAEKPKRMKIL